MFFSHTIFASNNFRAENLCLCSIHIKFDFNSIACIYFLKGFLVLWVTIVGTFCTEPVTVETSTQQSIQEAQPKKRAILNDCDGPLIGGVVGGLHSDYVHSDLTLGLNAPAYAPGYSSGYLGSSGILGGVGSFGSVGSIIPSSPIISAGYASHAPVISSSVVSAPIISHPPIIAAAPVRIHFIFPKKSKKSNEIKCSI